MKNLSLSASSATNPQSSPPRSGLARAVLPFLLLAGWAAGLPFGSRLPAADLETLDEHLAPLRPFLGKTWKGEFRKSTPEHPQFDVARWERAMNGKAVRVLHSVNNGAYGGETLIVWDAEEKKVVYHYFTTAGFHTTGLMAFDGPKYTTHEIVKGNANGVTEVKANGELKPDGTYHSESQYLKNGEWVPGHAIVYREDPDAKVIFK